MPSEQINKVLATAFEFSAAGKKAAAQGEVIIAERRNEWSIRPGPARARFPASKPRPKPDLPEYVLTGTDYDNVKAVVTMMKIIKIGKSAGLRAAAYRDVGTRLEELRHDRDEAQWGDLLRQECGLSSKRAYELMAMAKDDKPRDLLRSETSAGIKKHIEKKAA